MNAVTQTELTRSPSPDSSGGRSQAIEHFIGECELCPQTPRVGGGGPQFGGGQTAGLENGAFQDRHISHPLPITLAAACAPKVRFELIRAAMRNARNERSHIRAAKDRNG